MPHLQHPEGVSLYLDSFLSNAVSLKSPLLSAPFSFNSISLWSIFFRQKNYIYLEKFWRFSFFSCSLSNWEKNNEMKKNVISPIVYFSYVWGSQHSRLSLVAFSVVECKVTRYIFVMAKMFSCEIIYG